MNAVEYLESAKVDEVASQLERDGYAVSRTRGNNDAGYDLIAAKSGRRIAVSVKAKSSLRESASSLAELRDRAVKQGFNEFRVVVVNPPREKSIEIEGLTDALAGYLTNGSIPKEISSLSADARISGVSQLEIEALDATASGIRVRGSGAIDVRFGQADPDDLSASATDFPFSFDVILDHGLKLSRVNSLTINTSGVHN